MKSYTDLEQSKKLADILPPESADACWTNHLFSDFLSSWRIESTPPQEYKCLLDRFVVKGYLIEPAWSLAALLSAIPDASLPRNVLGWQCISYKNCVCIKGDTADNPIDACYGLVLKLNELNLL